MSATGKWLIVFLLLSSSFGQAQNLSPAQMRLAQEFSTSNYTLVAQLRHFENILLALGYKKVDSSLTIRPFSAVLEERECPNGGKKFEGETCVQTVYEFVARYQKGGSLRHIRAEGDLYLTAQTFKFITFIPPANIDLE